MRIPVEIRAEGATGYDTRQSRNLSLGGLALQSDYAFVLGSFVVVRIPLVRPVFETRARVAWCMACKEDFELGIEFLNDEDAFRARMVEQLCYIENYKISVLRDEGRRLSIDEAAREWISKYASEFPEVGKPQLH
jgi:hypothetical protein